jgi:hypothetical protein
MVLIATLWHTDESMWGPDVLIAFCFPYGVSIRFFPRACLEGAKRVGWFGETGDKYQLKAFTRIMGATKHGLALVVQEELQFDSEAQRRRIMESLKKRMRGRQAVRKVVIWWRRVLNARRRKAEEEEAFKNNDSSLSALNHVSNYFSFAIANNQNGSPEEFGFGSGRDRLLKNSGRYVLLCVIFMFLLVSWMHHIKSLCNSKFLFCHLSIFWPKSITARVLQHRRGFTSRRTYAEIS